MSKIRVLSDQLANQIAAGEVVERPASVVKELVENSLDAGARKIAVDIEGGGRRLLRITDDGEGMSRDDAVLAFERHATSKIRSSEDLTRILTLGFRGEALASIASVARVELTTKTDADKAATRVVIEGGRVRDVRDAAHPRGTTLTVRDLFFNVPARRKFLRSEATETYHLINLVTHYALAHPDVAFTLTNNGRETLRCAPARDVKERAYQLFGEQFIESLLEVAGGQELVVTVRGYVSAPSERRTSREAQYLFVNNRFVRDKVIARALSDAYRAVLPGGSHPAALLFLQIPPEEVDVNVHPAKTEVRFRRASAVGDITRDTIRGALARSGYVRSGDERYAETVFTAARDAEEASKSKFQIPRPAENEQSVIEFGAEPEISDLRSPISDSGPSEANDAEGQRARPKSINLAPPGAKETEAAGLRAPAGKQPEAVEFLPTRPAKPSAAIQSSEPPVALPAGNPELVAAAHLRSETSNLESVALPSFVSAAHLLREVPVEALSGNIRPLGQMDDSFIIATDEEGLLLIDQHIAHERILFNRYRRREDARPIESQRLLLPETFDLTPAQAVVFDQVADDLEKCGFELMRLSGRTVAIKAAPADLPAAETRTLLAEILDAIERERRGSARQDWRDHIAAKLACRAAVKAHTKLAPEKLRWLIDNLLASEAPATGPHGRPGILRLTTRDIEKGLQRG
jgi:DNA mismatch repair protein MutL